MNSNEHLLVFNNQSKHDTKIKEALSTYVEKTFNEDGSVNYKEVPTTYFWDNNVWHMDFFRSIAQFKNELSKESTISFSFNNSHINSEVKFVTNNMILADKWKLTNAAKLTNYSGKKLAEFINEIYPKLNSILDLDIEDTNTQWINWLIKNKVKINYYAKENSRLSKKSVYLNSPTASYLKMIYSILFKLTDDREEWEKNSWDVRNLKQYGINYSKSTSDYFIHFEKISNKSIRNSMKRYVKQRLIANDNFSWNTARSYMTHLPRFMNFITTLEPTWNDFRHLDRYHIEKYVEWINTYVKNNSAYKESNKDEYIRFSLTFVQKFLQDIQLREYSIAPIKDARILLSKSDKPRALRKSSEEIKYVPDIVLEQLFEHINQAPASIVPVVWIMYKTGLRISDALELRQNCLIKLNNKFWIETDIEKTYIKEHRIPIDDELAHMIAILIDTAKKHSNQDNNPQNYIFVKYNGSRKGKTYSQKHVISSLNLLAIDNNITDESGNVYHFKNHAFRHTYAI